MIFFFIRQQNNDFVNGPLHKDRFKTSVSDSRSSPATYKLYTSKSDRHCEIETHRPSWPAGVLHFSGTEKIITYSSFNCLLRTYELYLNLK